MLLVVTIAVVSHETLVAMQAVARGGLAGHNPEEDDLPAAARTTCSNSPANNPTQEGRRDL
jgi:hypothetical protein